MIPDPSIPRPCRPSPSPEPVAPPIRRAVDREPDDFPRPATAAEKQAEAREAYALWLSRPGDK